MTPHLPCVDGSGRGLDDGECVHCDDCGCLGDGHECRARLRVRLDAAELLIDAMAEALERVLGGGLPYDRARHLLAQVQEYTDAD